MTLTTTFGNLTLAADLDAAGQPLTLTSNGAIGQGAGAITAASLTGSSVGGLSLTDANRIGALGPFINISGGFNLTDNQALTVNGVLTDIGGGITLTTSGDLTLAAALNVLGQTSNVTSVGTGSQSAGTNTAASVSINAGGDVDLESSIAAPGSISVQAPNGSIDQTGSIVSGASTSFRAADGVVIDGGSITAGTDIAIVDQFGGLLVITPAGAPAGFTSLTATGQTSLSASNGSIVIGEAPFVTAVESFLTSHPGDQLNISNHAPSIDSTPTEGRTFITTGTLQVSSDMGIVQQNTQLTPGMAGGVTVLNPNRSASPIILGGVQGGSPSVVDLFLTMVNQQGAILSGNLVATSGEIDLTVAKSNFYRINGCVIGQTGECNALSDEIVNIIPSNLTVDLELISVPKTMDSDPTLSGTGNEEIWRHKTHGGK